MFPCQQVSLEQPKQLHLTQMLASLSNRLYTHREISMAMIEWVEYRLDVFGLDQIDALLGYVDVHRVEPPVILALLRTTHRAREYLQNWAQLRDQFLGVIVDDAEWMARMNGLL